MCFALYRLSALLLAGILDQIFGDPKGLPHPICGIGNLISGTEKWTRPLFPKTKGGERAAGVYLVVFVALISTAIPLVIVTGMYRLNRLIGVLAEGVLLYYTFAAKSLGTESMAVFTALKNEGLAAGRDAVSMIVGRDTEKLTEEGVIKAAVETVAENTSDGVVAPIFYALLGGAPLAYFYKAVNTMDSMVGYKNERYQFYGTAAAKLDDLVNFLPARLSALLMIAAYLCVKNNWRREGVPRQTLREIWNIYRRDRRAHASPNSAHTESVMAGALGVRLAGDASYFGVLCHKPTIGDDLRPVERADIPRANALMKTTAYLCWGLALFILFLFWLV